MRTNNAETSRRLAGSRSLATPRTVSDITSMRRDISAAASSNFSSSSSHSEGNRARSTPLGGGSASSARDTSALDDS